MRFAVTDPNVEIFVSSLILKGMYMGKTERLGYPIVIRVTDAAGSRSFPYYAVEGVGLVRPYYDRGDGVLAGSLAVRLDGDGWDKVRRACMAYEMSLSQIVLSDCP